MIMLTLKCKAVSTMNANFVSLLEKEGKLYKLSGCFLSRMHANWTKSEVCHQFIGLIFIGSELL